MNNDPFDDNMSAFTPPLNNFDLATGMSLASPYDIHDSTLPPFDLESFPGSDIPSHFPPHMKRFSTTYEDNISDALSTYEVNFPVEHQPLPDNVALDADNPLLSFSPLQFNCTPLDQIGRTATAVFNATLVGLFFLSEGPPATFEDTMPSPPVVTCYRRNLFSVEGTFALSRSLRSVLNARGEHMPVNSLELALTATETIEGSLVKLISVPYKSALANQPPGEERIEKEPPPIQVDVSDNTMDAMAEVVSFPVVWKRIQFRISTANNGRRKELQQHFMLRVTLTARAPNGQKIAICSATSGPLVVRGRSPRNFQNKREPPPTSAAANGAEKKATATKLKTGDKDLKLTNLGSEHDFLGRADDAGLATDLIDWKLSPTQPGPLGQTGFDANESLYGRSSPDRPRHTYPRQTPVPVNLSLIDEEPKPKRPADAFQGSSARKIVRLAQINQPPSSNSFSGMNSAVDDDASATYGYEYFPLGLDEWQEPVDAVYRPHVVHHIETSSEARLSATRTRSKTYFSEMVT